MCGRQTGKELEDDWSWTLSRTTTWKFRSAIIMLTISSGIGPVNNRENTGAYQYYREAVEVIMLTMYMKKLLDSD